MSFRQRAGAVTGMAVLAGGLAAALPTAAYAGTGTGPCTSGTAVPVSGITSCTSTGMVGILSGGLTINAPASETWSTTLNGQTQLLFDTTSTDEGMVASDLRGLLSGGTGSGWNITASGTTFTGSATKTTIPDSGTQVLAFNGGGTASTDSATPSAACFYGVLSCVTPTSPTPPTVSYPAFVPTAGGSPLRIYNAVAGSGTGVIQIGASGATNPGVWSVTLPPTLAVDTYTSTITLTIGAGP